MVNQARQDDSDQVRNRQHEESDQRDDPHCPLEPKKIVGHTRYTHNTPTYPISSIKFRAAIGMIVPPSDDPVAMIPNANDLRFLNHCEMMVGSGLKIIPQDNPVRKP